MCVFVYMSMLVCARVCVSSGITMSLPVPTPDEVRGCVAEVLCATLLSAPDEYLADLKPVSAPRHLPSRAARCC